MSTFRQPMLLLDRSLSETGKTDEIKTDGDAPVPKSPRNTRSPSTLVCADVQASVDGAAANRVPDAIFTLPAGGRTRSHRRPRSKSHRFKVLLPPPRKNSPREHVIRRRQADVSSLTGSLRKLLGEAMSQNMKIIIIPTVTTTGATIL